MRHFLSVLMLAGLLVAPPASALAEAAEIEFWQSVKDSQLAAELEAKGLSEWRVCAAGAPTNTFCKLKVGLFPISADIRFDRVHRRRPPGADVAVVGKDGW